MRAAIERGNLLAVFTICLAILLGCARGPAAMNAVLLEDDFSALPAGMFSVPVGPHTEYHYLKEAAPKGNWAVSCFTWEPGAQRAWWVIEENGSHALAQTFDNRDMMRNHPMVVSGDTLWTDYRLTVKFAADSRRARCGVVFRYRNDRCNYFFGLEGDKLVLKMIQDATGYHKPYEKILSEKDFTWETGKYYTAEVSVAGPHIRASLEGGPELEAVDSTYHQGKIGLISDVPARYSYVNVSTTGEQKDWIAQVKAEGEKTLAELRAANPKPVLWKKISTKGFGVGRNLRFGDLDGDSVPDVLIAQVVHHGGPSDNYSEVSCLTAMTFDGKVLWQAGQPDPEKNHLTNDVGVQVHDLDGDGRNEAVYTMKMELIVADGATGRIKYKAPTPKAKAPADSFPRILGDCLYFCDLRGTGRDADIIIKDRYWHLWAMDDKLRPLWESECMTGHYPYAYDVDGDGKDELLMGYTLFSPTGEKLWSLDSLLEDHADGVSIVNYLENEGSVPRAFFACSDEGAMFTDLQGNILQHYYIGHVQNPAIADFRADLTGLETVTINFWGNQGIIHFYDSRGKIYFDFEPTQYGSMCLPINWTGEPEEFFVLNANVREGGMFDGWGRPVVAFPDDGHPDMCNAVLDITGDCRDEVVVWNPDEIWVYTQDDNLKTGKLYKPVRNPLYNYSNYQTTVSLPGWSE